MGNARSLTGASVPQEAGKRDGKLAGMKHLHLLIPDLFPPQDIAAEVCAGLQLPALEKLLARGNAGTTPTRTLEDWLCTAFGAQAVAPVRAAADGLAADEGYWLCADPVNLQLQRAQMLLLPDVLPSREEAGALCASLNEHFAGMGVRFFAPHPQRWYVKLDVDQMLATTPLRQAAWRDAKFHQPQGAEALRWQAIVNEVQMLLHGHGVNQARAARGELAINSLWLWGGGRAARLNRAFDAAGGDCVLGMAFAQAAGVPQVVSLQAMLGGEGESGLWICAAPGEAQQRGDYLAWREAVQRVEQDCALPLLRALRTGRLQGLALEVSHGEGARRFELTRASAWKLWRAAPSLARYAV